MVLKRINCFSFEEFPYMYHFALANQSSVNSNWASCISNCHIIRREQRKLQYYLGNFPGSCITEHGSTHKLSRKNRTIVRCARKNNGHSAFVRIKHRVHQHKCRELLWCSLQLCIRAQGAHSTNNRHLSCQSSALMHSNIHIYVRRR